MAKDYFYVELSESMTLGPKEKRVPVMRNHKGKPSGKAAPSAPPSTMEQYKSDSIDKGGEGSGVKGHYSTRKIHHEVMELEKKLRDGRHSRSHEQIRERIAAINAEEVAKEKIIKERASSRAVRFGSPVEGQKQNIEGQKRAEGYASNLRPDADPEAHGVNLPSPGRRGAMKSEVASVAVMNDDDKTLLMGKRRDNGRWTLPGGHLESGEDPTEGAKRELAEEAGIKSDKLKKLGSKKITTFTGKEMTVHSFVVPDDGQKPNTKNDPDKEVHKWERINVSNGLPKEIAENLHSPKNVTLKLLGLQKSFQFFVTAMSGMPITKAEEDDASRAAIRVGMARKIAKLVERRPELLDKNPDWKKYQDMDKRAQETRQEHQQEKPGAQNDQFDKEFEEEKEEAEKSFYFVEPSFFISDIIKSGTHKYLRKYMRGGKWIYIYHEGENRPRRLTDEHMEHIKKLSELGDVHAKALHDTLQPHDEKHLDMIRKLADLGDEHAKKHLHDLGIDRDKEKLEEQLIPRAVANKDPIEENLSDTKASEARSVIKTVAAKEMYDHLFGSSHRSTPLAQALIRADLTKEKFFAAIDAQKSLSGMMKAMHEEMKKVDAAQNGLTSQRTEVTASGGYGNHTYNAAIKKLEEKEILPEGYSEVHKRGSDEYKVHPTRGLAEKVAKKKAERQERERRELAERQERERRELAEVHGSMAHAMSSMMIRPMPTSEIIALNRRLKEIFGKELRKEDWPYDFSQSGLTAQIESCNVSGNTVRLEMKVLDNEGNDIMDGWTRTFSRENGRPHIENAYMRVKAGARTGVQVGNMINAGQRKLIRSIPGGGTVGVHANCDVGGYNWANQGFTLNGGRSSLQTMRDKFLLFCQSKGVDVRAADLEHFTELPHFAAFDNGKEYMHTSRDPMPLSEKQKEARSLTGEAGKHPLTDSELRSGESNRMVVHLGKKFLLTDTGRSYDWFGTWDSERDTVSSQYADKYKQLRERAVKLLGNQYNEIVSRVKASPERFVVPADRPVTPRSSIGSGSATVDRHIRDWSPRQPGSNMILTPKRLSRVMRLSPSEIDLFLRHAPLSLAAKHRIREARRQNGV